MLAALMLLSGCASVTPEPVGGPELLRQSGLDRAFAARGVAPIGGPVSLDEAMARALKYNLDRRGRMMEEAVAMNLLATSKYDMLPKLLAAAGYRHRNSDATTRAVDSVTGAPSLANPFISSEREHTVSDLGLTWNLLDFGLSYVAAKQNADRRLIAAERRRKAMHLLMQDVRTAFWRTASAQKLRATIRDSIVMAEGALADARQAEAERLRSPIDSLRYQRQVLENLRLLEGIDQELASARIELANFINAPLSHDLIVVEPAEQLSSAILEQSVEALELRAIANNADLREQHYNARIAHAETRKVMLRMFPNLNLNAGLKYDTDKYLVNNQWSETGAQISFNLFNLLSMPAQQRLADSGVALADQRRVTAQMAILAQVHLARLHYGNALQQFRRADAIWNVDERINQHGANRAQTQTQSKLEKVSNNTTAILSLLRRYQALALAHAAASKLQAVLGMEPAVANQVGLPLDQLTAAIGSALRHENQFGTPPPAPAAAPAAAPATLEP
ncbi:TolC family protein [Massilia glaciei]|uniref:TolC family protein n=1 Tax=Massilia glaciei TaxID=1524097 RepID=A0A2U2HMX8_9BURK|nr:TolC family protein [Massilia glaciei]